MKKLNLRKPLIALLSILMIVATTLGIMLASTVDNSVRVQAAFEPTTETIEMELGAEIRDEGKSGLRFSSYINGVWLWDLIDGAGEGATYEVGTLIIPESKLAGAELTYDNALAAKAIHTEDKWAENGLYYKVSAVLIDIPEIQYATKLVARSYVKIGDAEPVYAQNPQTRALAATASMAIANGYESEVLTGIIDKTIESVALTSGSSAEAFALPEGKEQALTVAITGKADLVEAPVASDYAISLTSDSESVTVKNSTITSVSASDEMATITANVAGKTATLQVKPTLADSNGYLIENNFWGNEKTRFIELIYGGGTNNIASNSLPQYIKEGTSSWLWSAKNQSYSCLSISYGLYRIRNYVNKIWDIDNLFYGDETLTSLSFDVYNATASDREYKIGRSVLASGKGSVWYTGTLKAGEWTTVNITREIFKNTETDSAIFGSYTGATTFSFTINDSTAEFNMYIDNIKLNYDNDSVAETADNEFEEKFYIERGYANSFIYSIYGGGKHTFTTNANSQYITEGSSSVQWRMNGQTYSALQLSYNHEDGITHIDDIFANSNVTAFSFKVYNASEKDLTYNLGQWGNYTLTGTLAANAWTTITITRADFDAIEAIFTSSIVFRVETNIATTIYLDAFEVSESPLN